jgi:hypothetical protein
MRVAVALGSFARLIDRHIFQPTYHVDEAGVLRELLYRQAPINQRKERFLRGLLLSMYPDDQNAHGEDCIDSVIDGMRDSVGVGEILPVETMESFENDLEQLVERFQEVWKTIQRSFQKLEPNFTYCITPDRPWQILRTHLETSQNGNKAEVHAVTNNVEDNVVVIPRIYLMETDKDPAPITFGLVLQKVQLDAAAEEIRNAPPSAPFAPSNSIRHRNRPSRTLSTGGERNLGKRRNTISYQ